MAGELGEQAVVGVVRADAGDVEGETLLAEFLDALRETVGVGVAEIGGSVGEKDDAVLRAIELVAKGEF